MCANVNTFLQKVGVAKNAASGTSCILQLRRQWSSQLSGKNAGKHDNAVKYRITFPSSNIYFITALLRGNPVHFI